METNKRSIRRTLLMTGSLALIAGTLSGCFDDDDDQQPDPTPTMAPSLSTRRQAGSQGASQTRPQIEENGLVAVIASKASANLPSQI